MLAFIDEEQGVPGKGSQGVGRLSVLALWLVVTLGTFANPKFLHWLKWGNWMASTVSTGDIITQFCFLELKQQVAIKSPVVLCLSTVQARLWQQARHWCSHHHVYHIIIPVVFFAVPISSWRPWAVTVFICGSLSFLNPDKPLHEGKCNSTLDTTQW